MKIIEPKYEIVDPNCIKMVMAKKDFFQYLYQNRVTNFNIEMDEREVCFIKPDYIETGTRFYLAWSWSNKKQEELFHRRTSLEDVPAEQALASFLDDVAVYAYLTPYVLWRSLVTHTCFPSFEGICREALKEIRERNGD